jgi:sugar phosphate isomerase/epimerase
MSLGFERAVAEGRMKHEEVLRCCKEGGAGGFEPSTRFIKDMRGRAKELLEKYELEVPCVDVQVELIQRDPAARAAAAEELISLVNLAQYLGAQGLMIVPGGLRDGITFEEALPWVVSGIERAMPRAAEMRVTLMVEQMGYEGAFCRTREQLLAIAGAIPPIGSFGLCFDGGNSVRNGEDPVAILVRLAHRVQHVHLKDWTREGDLWRNARLGEGIVPQKEMLEQLRYRDYRGYLSVEHSGDGDPCEEAQHGIAYARRLMGEGAA